MTTNRNCYYVAFDTKFSYVRGLDAAHAKLAEYLGTTAEDVRINKRKLAGLIRRVSAAEARSAGLRP